MTPILNPPYWISKILHIIKNNFEINFKNQKNVLKKERIWNKMVKKISKYELKTKSLNDTKFWYYII